MSDTQNPTTENNENCNCCSNTDGRNVINVCAPGNTLYIGCTPAGNGPCDNQTGESADNSNA